MNSKLKQNLKPFVILSLFLFVVFAVLAYCTPYTLDDWAWGDKIGQERLDCFFAGYNGRYLGNLLILLLSNSRVALVLCMAVSYCAACLIPCFFSKNTALPVLLLSAVTFFILPKSIYAQIVSWASGYTNYMPPVLLLAVYYIIIKNIFTDKKTKYPKYMPLIAFVIGLSAALFMENITLANVALGVLIIIFVLIKEKRVYVTHLAFLAGAVLGAAIMFTNTAYGIISDGGDDYRSTAFEDGGIIKTVIEHINLTVNHMFVWNLFLCIIASGVFAVICVLYVKSTENRKAAFFAKVIAAANVFSLFIFFVKYKYSDWQIHSEKFMNLFMIGAVGLYCLSLFAGIILCVKSKETKFKLLLLFVTVGAIVAPLMVVNPITARCYYPPYFIISMMVVEMFSYVLKEINVSEKTKKAISAALFGGLLALCMFFLSIFHTIHTFDTMRSEYIEKQNLNNEKTVVVSTLPYKDYLWYSSPGGQMWVDRFKVYYKIDPEAKTEFIDYSKFKKWAAEYDKEHPVNQNK